MAAGVPHTLPIWSTRMPLLESTRVWEIWEMSAGWFCVEKVSALLFLTMVPMGIWRAELEIAVTTSCGVRL